MRLQQDDAARKSAFNTAKRKGDFAINGNDEYTFNATKFVLAAANDIQFSDDSSGILDSNGNLQRKPAIIVHGRASEGEADPEAPADEEEDDA